MQLFVLNRTLVECVRAPAIGDQIVDGVVRGGGLRMMEHDRQSTKSQGASKRVLLEMNFTRISVTVLLAGDLIAAFGNLAVTPLPKRKRER